MKSLILLSVFSGNALAQVANYGQCGGKGWTGETSCSEGWVCKDWNEWYSQCIADDGNTGGDDGGDDGDEDGDEDCDDEDDDSSSTSYVNVTTVRVPATTFQTFTTLRTSTRAEVTISVEPSVETEAPIETTFQTIPSVTANVPETTAPVEPTQTSKASSVVATPTRTPSSGKLKWVGVDESVAEFGEHNYPGTYGVDYTFPDEDAISTLISDRYNIFRVPFLMERMAVESLTSSLAQEYLANLTATVDYITSNGAWAVLDPHNYGRYKGSVISDSDGFKTFWKNVATAFKANEKVVFDTNNEYHDMDQSLVLKLNQAAIDGIRAAGATSQYIFIEGNSWSGAWHWNTTNDNLADLTDPQDKLIYEMHQYLDSDGSGTSETCVSSIIGAERLSGATEWLKENGKLGILGEFAGGPNTVCKDAVTGLLDHLEANSDVWLGALWWAAGPWWKDYMYSFEPPSGKGYVYYNSLLQSYI